jgi:hypothetical protein
VRCAWQDTQNPVLYIEYAGLGRLKLVGTIVRSKGTRYFSLNVKSRDRMHLEDWFESLIVFSRYSWVGRGRPLVLPPGVMSHAWRVSGLRGLRFTVWGVGCRMKDLGLGFRVNALGV